MGDYRSRFLLVVRVKAQQINETFWMDDVYLSKPNVLDSRSTLETSICILHHSQPQTEDVFSLLVVRLFHEENKFTLINNQARFK